MEKFVGSPFGWDFVESNKFTLKRIEKTDADKGSDNNNPNEEQNDCWQIVEDNITPQEVELLTSETCDNDDTETVKG